MDNTNAPVDPAPTWTDRLTPRAGARPQLVGAAFMWLVGGSILLVRGVSYLSAAHWAVWIIALAVLIGVLKSRMLLDRIARRAVARIYERDHACFFGFFSVKSWLFVVAMMGGGILLRSSGLPKGVLAVIYLGIGAALAIADRIFWKAAFAPSPIEAPVAAAAPAPVAVPIAAKHPAE